MSLVTQLMFQALIGGHKCQRPTKCEVSVFLLSTILMVVGLAFLVIADYQYMSSLYSRPQAMALTAASVLFVSFLGFLVLAIFKGKRKADTQIIHTLAKELEKPVQDNPGTAILIAMLAGMIFGRKI